MRIVEINMCAIGSTGKIMFQIADRARKSGNRVNTYSTYPPSKKYKKLPAPPDGHKYYGSYLSTMFHYGVARIFGRNGCYSIGATKRLIREIKKFKPDILHLHNLHCYCINLSLLFKYIKKNNIRVIWTLHDCWTFTGHCPYFDMIGCEKWKTGCYQCPQIGEYPASYTDTSKWMYEHKKKWFTGVEDMTLVTPSKWLADLTRQSFLKDYPVKVINNGIDLNVFKPTESDFRKKYGLEDKFIVLGVAFGWGKRKGLDVFIELSKRLDERYQIVLVGTNENVDKQLPKSIISIHRTQNQTELAEIYTAADLFVNPTREEVLGLVNIEALACGTSVVTFNSGGSPECIDETCGVVVEKNDIDGMQREIERICESRPFGQEACIKRAQHFDMNDKFAEYVALYEKRK